MKEDLYNEFVALVDQGDEDKARQFLIDHVNEFPDETRKEIAYAFCVDAVKNEAVISEIQKKGLEMMKEFDEAEAMLAEAAQVATLRESI